MPAGNRQRPLEDRTCALVRIRPYRKTVAVAVFNGSLYHKRCPVRWASAIESCYRKGFASCQRVVFVFHGVLEQRENSNADNRPPKQQGVLKMQVRRGGRQMSYPWHSFSP